MPCTLALSPVYYAFCILKCLHHLWWHWFSSSPAGIWEEAYGVQGWLQEDKWADHEGAGSNGQAEYGKQDLCVCFAWALSLHLTNHMLKLSNVHALHLQKQMGYVQFASLEPQQYHAIQPSWPLAQVGGISCNRQARLIVCLSYQVRLGTSYLFGLFVKTGRCTKATHLYARLFNQARLGTRSFLKTGR